MCARGDGIRGSKDLQAEIGKFLNSTNERKQMSTKTLKKRIALVAVSALAAGFLSVGSTQVANAADNVAYGTASPNGAAGVLNIGTTTNVTSSPVITATNGAPASVGLVDVSSLGSNKYAGTTQTAVLMKTGVLTVYTLASATATDTNYSTTITVEGGVISTTGANVDNTNTARTIATCTNVAANCVVAISPNSGATSMTVRSYNAAGAVHDTDGTITEATVYAGAVASPTSGTLTGQITVTLVDAATNGVLSTSKSGAYWVATYDASAVTSDVAGYSGSTDFGQYLYLDVRVRDGYSTAITSTGLLQAVATGGAYVNIAPSSASNTGAAATDFYSGAAPDSEEILISNPTGNPMAGTVTVTWEGTVIATRTYGFSGKVAKVELSSPVIGKTSSTSNNIATYTLRDAAGNVVYADYSGTDNSATPPSGLAARSAAITGSASAVSTSATGSRDLSISLTTGVVTSGRVVFTCSSTAGAGTIGLTYTNNDGSTVNSNDLAVKCAGDAVKYTASYDKAVYAPGEIATLTLKFVDSKGNAANDITDVDSDGTAGEISISTSGMAQTVSGPSDSGASGADIDQGTLTFKYAVGTTEGTYTNVINVPDVNEAATAANLSGTAAVSATFTVKSSSTAVSNADVLKSIVALIASINKQIQALQKLILKR